MNMQVGQHGEPVEVIMGRNIKALRDARGLTQKDVADAIGTYPIQVYKWEKGKHRPSAKLEAALAQLLCGGDVSALYVVHEANGEAA